MGTEQELTASKYSTQHALVELFLMFANYSKR